MSRRRMSRYSRAHLGEHFLGNGMIFSGLIPVHHLEGFIGTVFGPFHRGVPPSVVAFVETWEEPRERRFGTGTDLLGEPLPKHLVTAPLKQLRCANKIARRLTVRGGWDQLFIARRPSVDADFQALSQAVDYLERRMGLRDEAVPEEDVE